MRKMTWEILLNLKQLIEFGCYRIECNVNSRQFRQLLGLLPTNQLLLPKGIIRHTQSL